MRGIVPARPFVPQGEQAAPLRRAKAAELRRQREALRYKCRSEILRRRLRSSERQPCRD